VRNAPKVMERIARRERNKKATTAPIRCSGCFFYVAKRLALFQIKN
jgi:hypothetical protein